MESYGPVARTDADSFELSLPHRGITGGQRPRGNVRKMTRFDLLKCRWDWIAPSPVEVSEKEVQELLSSSSRNLTLIKAVVIKNDRRRDTEAMLLFDLMNWSQELQEKVDALSAAPTLNLRMR